MDLASLGQAGTWLEELRHHKGEGLTGDNRSFDYDIDHDYYDTNQLSVALNRVSEQYLH